MLLIQLFYYIFFFLRITLHKNKNNNFSKPVSVIIAARNEEKNLKSFLPSILNQDYPDFEVIVINDRSWDKSDDVINYFASKYSYLKLVTNPDQGKDDFSKKLALTLGIKSAKNDYLLFTDADCTPNSKYWIQEMVNGFKDNKMIVLGAGAYFKKKGFLNKLIRFDTAFIAIQYLGMAKARIPYMGVGRNLAYRREMYDQVRGFKSHYHIASGDDDLFVNEAANKKNTSIIFSSESVTFSTPKDSLIDWIKQKRRHHLTYRYYKKSHQFILITYHISLLVFYISLVVLFTLGSNVIIGLIFFLFRILLQIIIFMRPFNKLNCKDLVIFVPILELTLILLFPLLQIKKQIK